MSEAPLEHFTFTHPWLSSDFCVRSVRPSRVLFGVADMIGHPRGLRWRNYMRVLNRYIGGLLDAPPAETVGDLEAKLREHLLWHDRQVHRFRISHDRAAFGFCVLFAIFDGAGGRILWLGDCRAYRVRRGARDPATGERAFEVVCLTRDHNAMGEMIEAGEPLTLFRTEMTEQTKRLSAFLGLGAEDRVRDLLSRSIAIPPLSADDCLLLMTDGVYTPHLRAQMDATNFRVSAPHYYLEPWFANLFAAADRRIPPEEPNYWPELATILVEETLAMVRRRPHYRDDMALCGLCAPNA